MNGYDSKCFRSTKEYHKAKHNYNVRKNSANFNIMITKSKIIDVRLKEFKINREQLSLNS